MTMTAALPSGYSYVAKSGVTVTSCVKPKPEGPLWVYLVWYYYARTRWMFTGRRP